jgi:hypothetical protein
MGDLTIQIVVIAIVAALLGLWAYRRSTKPTRATTGTSQARKQKQVEQWGVRIAAPAGGRACPQVQELLGKEFPMSKKPTLPLPDCPYSHQCECLYIKLFDRRKHERRSEQDRRQAQRFEKDNPPRRSGKDRRQSQIDWGSRGHV